MPDYLHTQNKFVLVNNVKIAYRELGANTSDLQRSAAQKAWDFNPEMNETV